MQKNKLKSICYDARIIRIKKFHVPFDDIKKLIGEDKAITKIDYDIALVALNKKYQMPEDSLVWFIVPSSNHNNLIIAVVSKEFDPILDTDTIPEVEPEKINHTQFKKGRK